MSTINGVDSILSQIRAMRQATGMADIGAVSGAMQANAPREVQQTPGFGQLLKQTVDSVNELQKSSAAKQEAYVRGEDISLTQVMVAMQKSDVSFKAAMEVRNKMIDAYQEVMRMSV